jgi:hypothetical protein
LANGYRPKTLCTRSALYKPLPLHTCLSCGSIAPKYRLQHEGDQSVLPGVRHTFGKLAAIYRLHWRHHGLMQSAVLVYWCHHGLRQSAVLIYCRYHGLMQPVVLISVASVLISVACNTNILDICDNHTRAYQLDLRESPTPISMGSSQVRHVGPRSTTWRVARDRTGRDRYDASTDAGSPRMPCVGNTPINVRVVQKQSSPKYYAPVPSMADSSGRACNTSGALHHTLRELLKGSQLEPKRSMVVYRG